MSLDYPICVENVGISILSDTSPAAVEYDGRLWVFYNGSGDDGIWYTRFDGTGWEHARCTRVGVSAAKDVFLHRKGTSPCPLVHEGRLFLFWSNRLADGILCSVWNGKRFRSVAHDIGALSGQPISLGNHTSPAAASFDGKIYLFWNGDGGLCFTTGQDDDEDPENDEICWRKAERCSDHVADIGVAPGTSPALAVYNDALHVFYNGMGNDGTWYFTYASASSSTSTLMSTSSSWSKIVSIQQTVGGNGFLSKTSPVALTMTKDPSNHRLGLFWTGAGVNGVWYSLFNDGRWYQQQSVLKAISNHALHSNSNCSAVQFLHEPYIFWAGLEGGLWFTTRRIYDVLRDEREVFSIFLAGCFDEIHMNLPLSDPELVRNAFEQLLMAPNQSLDNGSKTKNAFHDRRFLTTFISSMTSVTVGKSFYSGSGIYTFASLIYLAMSKGYAIKMEFLLPNASIKAEVTGPGKENSPYQVSQKRDAEL